MLHPFSITCMFFWADQRVLGNTLESLYLGKIHFPSFRSYYLLAAACHLRVEACEIFPIHIGRSTGAVMFRLIILLKFYGCCFSVTYKRQYLMLAGLFLWLFTLFLFSLQWCSLKIKCKGYVMDKPSGTGHPVVIIQFSVL